MPENKNEVKKDELKPKKVLEYVPFKEVPTADLKKMPSVKCTLEKRSSKEYGDSARLTIEIHPKFKKVISSTKMLDMRKYNLIVAVRDDFKEDEAVHIAKVPMRCLQRHDSEGNVLYQRVEVMFTRNVVISDFFDFTDQDLIQALGIDLEFIEDKESSKVLSLSQAETDYSYFN